MKESKESYNFLVKLFRQYPEQQKNKMVNFCKLIVSSSEFKKTHLDCRHGDCYSFGTVEKKKHPGIRKSRIESFLSEQGDVEFTPSTVSSTKLRCYHLSFFSTFANSIDDLDNALTDIDKGSVIRHVCGCTNCCFPPHLKLGTSADNLHDRGIHLLLKNAYDSGKKKVYRLLLKILKLLNFDQI